MKVYFLSSRPCILTLNGTYFGLTDTFERFAELSPKDNIFAQFTPEDGLPVQFFINESVRFHPPQHCDVYLLKDGIAIYAKDFPPSDPTLRAIAQKREDKTLVTVFRQGVTQVSIESPSGFFISPLPTSFEPSEIEFFENFVLLASSDAVAIFKTDGKRVLLEKIKRFSFKNGTLNATLPLSDRLNRTANCTWSLKDGECKQTQFSIEQKTSVSFPFEGGCVENTSETVPDVIRSEILPYAFFESVLIGADYVSLLSNELKEKAPQLKEFLGEFSSVVLTEKPHVCGLVRQKADRLFEVDEYIVEIENGKIIDVKSYP